MTYIFNNTTPQGATVHGGIYFYNLKTHLKSAGWTVLSSSDGTTYNPTGDQITSGLAGANGFSNTRAWFRIQAPDGYQEICIQNNANSFRIKYSRANNFVGGSPAATVTPSASDEIIVHGGGTDASPTYSSYLPNPPYRVITAADNTFPYTFWSCVIPQGGGALSTFLGLEYLTAVSPGDAHPYIFLSSIAAAGNFLNAGLSLQTRTTGSGSRSITYLASATPTVPIDAAAAIYGGGVGAAIFYPASGTSNPITNKNEIIPMLWGRSAAVANPGYKGIGTMMNWVAVTQTQSGTVLTGATLSISSTRDKIIFNTVALPWDGTVPIL